MSLHRQIRQTHRWTSMVFALLVAALFATQAMGWETPEWVFYLPLAPLALLLFTGLYLFALPYFRKR
ncbi:hypothetical protein P1J78_12020 [Psychromarinibacter sp. C21-152]|uniref:Uncharacterized protein n=1 Tax=Psychromarinibacter sediminicola TaxID=3033385 RepID=A0AAE3T8P3_9RHOB|nr:hypothetical protein [Psychromarinibacter sediminicola]MDF0601462.1 hypothetical protein [Psychromarinibacter sediminicola]